MKQQTHWLGWAYAAACLVMPLLAFILVLVIDDAVLEPATVATSDGALVQPVLSTVLDHRQIPLALEWGVQPVAPAPAEDGLVSGVFVEPGDAVEPGDPVLEIGGATLVATSDYLPDVVTSQSSDEAIGRVARLLVAAGHLEDPATSWQSASFALALDAFQHENGRPDVDRFEPSWTIWIPAEPFIVLTVETGIGQPMPPVGEPLLRGVASLLDARPVADAGPVLADPQGIYDISLGGKRLAGWGLELPVPADLLSELAASLDPGLDVVTVDAVLQGASELMSVPVTAVVTDETGSTCLVDDDGRSIRVEVVSSSPGVLDLLPVPDVPPVLVDPSPRRSCGE